MRKVPPSLMVLTLEEQAQRELTSMMQKTDKNSEKRKNDDARVLQ